MLSNWFCLIWQSAVRDICCETTRGWGPKKHYCLRLLILRSLNIPPANPLVWSFIYASGQATNREFTSVFLIGASSHLHILNSSELSGSGLTCPIKKKLHLMSNFLWSIWVWPLNPWLLPIQMFATPKWSTWQKSTPSSPCLVFYFVMSFQCIHNKTLSVDVFMEHL